MVTLPSLSVVVTAVSLPAFVSRVDSVLPAGTNGRAAAMPSSRRPSAVSRRSTITVAAPPRQLRHRLFEPAAGAAANAATRT